MLKNVSKKTMIAIAIIVFFCGIKLNSQTINSDYTELICYISVQDCSTCNSSLSGLFKVIKSEIIICPFPFNQTTINILNSSLEPEQNYKIIDPLKIFNELPKRSGIYLKSSSALQYFCDFQSSKYHSTLLNSIANSYKASIKDTSLNSSFMQYLSGIKLFNERYLTSWNSYTSKVFIADIHNKNISEINILNYDFQELILKKIGLNENLKYSNAFEIIKSMKKDKAELLQVLTSDEIETTLLLKIYIPILNESNSVEITPITFISKISNNLEINSLSIIDETKLSLCNSIDGYSTIKFSFLEIEVFLDFDLEYGKCKKKQWKCVFKLDSSTNNYLFSKYLTIKVPNVLLDKSIERDFIILENDEYISFNQLNEFYNTSSGQIDNFNIPVDVFNPLDGNNLIGFKIFNGLKYYTIEKDKSMYLFVSGESKQSILINLNKIYNCEFASADFSTNKLSLLDSNGNMFSISLN